MFTFICTATLLIGYSTDQQVKYNGQLLKFVKFTNFFFPCLIACLSCVDNLKT